MRIILSKHVYKTAVLRYGDDAGCATDNAMNSAINVGVTAFNIDHIGIKAVVKRTAKETGHAVLDEYKVLDNEKKDKKWKQWKISQSLTLEIKLPI